MAGTLIPIVNKVPQGAMSIVTATWGSTALGQTALTQGDTGTPVSLADWADRSIQISGTFSGSTTTLEGSNDGVTWNTLRDAASNLLSFTAADIKQILETTLWVRPKVITSTGAAITVVIVGRSLNPLAFT